MMKEFTQTASAILLTVMPGVCFASPAEDDFNPRPFVASTDCLIQKNEFARGIIVGNNMNYQFQDRREIDVAAYRLPVRAQLSRQARQADRCLGTIA